MDKLEALFKDKASKVFGSGWVWLVWYGSLSMFQHCCCVCMAVCLCLSLRYVYAVCVCACTCMRRYNLRRQDKKR
jgi:hypothetical protein